MQERIRLEVKKILNDLKLSDDDQRRLIMLEINLVLRAR